MFCDYRTLFPPKRPYILELFRRQEANKIRFAMLQMEFMVTELCLQREPFFGKRALFFWALFTQIGLFSYILVFFHTCRSLLLYMVSFHTCRSLLFTRVGLFWYIQVSFRTYRSLFIHVRLLCLTTLVSFIYTGLFSYTYVSFDTYRSLSTCIGLFSYM